MFCGEELNFPLINVGYSQEEMSSDLWPEGYEGPLYGMTFCTKGDTKLQNLYWFIDTPGTDLPQKLDAATFYGSIMLMEIEIVDGKCKKGLFKVSCSIWAKP